MIIKAILRLSPTVLYYVAGELGTNVTALNLSTNTVVWNVDVSASLGPNKAGAALAPRLSLSNDGAYLFGSSLGLPFNHTELYVNATLFAISAQGGVLQ